MSISIVTVVLNGGTDLALTIESVRQQEYRDVELIVVDGGSWDDTADVLARYDDVIDKVVHLEDAGIYHAMNTSLDHCHNDYVLFLNASDTLFSASTLQNLMTCKRPGVDIFFGNHVYVDKRKEYLKRSVAYDVSMDLLRRPLVDHTWLSRLPGHQATFVGLELLRKFRFNTAITICADHDLLVRAYNAGASFQYIDENVSRYNGGGFSAQMPSKLSLQWCALYRDQSSSPERIDRFFLGDSPSPFGPQNAYMGEWVCGNYPLEGAQPELGLQKPVAWCRPDVKLRTSGLHRSSRLRIEGYNPFDGQLLTIFHDNRMIGETKLDQGWFKRTIKLGQNLQPRAIVDVAATRLGEAPMFPNRTVIFAVASFAFEPADAGIFLATPGFCIPFTQANVQQTAQLLGDGWAHQEDNLIWTIGETADIWLDVATTVETIIIKCRGNPYITDQDNRGVEISVNGRPAGRHLIPSDREAKLEIEAGAIPANGNLLVRLRPLLRVKPPLDGRPLGVALISIEFAGRVSGGA